jgi:DNA invertase Pin-like site-specific DNA recombinase
MARKIAAAYVRVSTFDQQKGKDSQIRALTDYCENHGLGSVKFYQDTLTGATTKRPAFEKLQADIFMGKVHTVIVWKLDRLSRSLKDGVNVLTDWLEKGIRVVSVTQQLDFAGTTGQLVASVLFALAAMERENIRENTKRGMAAAKARGVKLGKRPKLFSRDIIPLLQSGLSVAQAANKLGRTRQAVYLALKREGISLNSAT